LFRDSGILILFLPPYSPDYSPTEEAFSYIKYYLKENDASAGYNPIPVIQAAFDSIPLYSGQLLTYLLSVNCLVRQLRVDKKRTSGLWA